MLALRSARVVPELVQHAARLVAHRGRARLQHEARHKAAQRQLAQENAELQPALRRLRGTRSASDGAGRAGRAGRLVARLVGMLRRSQAAGKQPHAGDERLVLEQEERAREEAERAAGARARARAVARPVPRLRLRRLVQLAQRAAELELNLIRKDERARLGARAHGARRLEELSHTPKLHLGEATVARLRVALLAAAELQQLPLGLLAREARAGRVDHTTDERAPALDCVPLVGDPLRTRKRRGGGGRRVCREGVAGRRRRRRRRRNVSAVLHSARGEVQALCEAKRRVEQQRLRLVEEIGVRLGVRLGEEWRDDARRWRLLLDREQIAAARRGRRLVARVALGVLRHGSKVSKEALDEREDHLRQLAPAEMRGELLLHGTERRRRRRRRRGARAARSVRRGRGGALLAVE